MNILIVAATKLEIIHFLKKLNYVTNNWENSISFEYKNIKVDVLITGIGLVFTTYHLSKMLTSKKYDLVLNTGIAGSFNKNLQIGDLCHITSEEFAGLGIEDKDAFKTLFETGLMKKNDFPFVDGKLKATELEHELINNLPKVKAISTNTAHGNEKTINELRKKFEADIETMEGAAFFFVCLMEKVKFAQIRAISNYAEKRNVENWNIPLALDNLSGFLINMLDQL